MEIKKIEIDKIKPDPSNPRKELEGVEELADTIKVQGQLVPMEIESLGNGKYMIQEGHRRGEALRILQKRTGKKQYANCILTDKMNAAEKAVKRAAIDAQMKNLGVEERDILWEKIWKTNKYSNKEFANMVGVNAGQVTHFLDRRSLKPEIREMFKENAGALQETISLEPEVREMVLKHAHKRGIGAMSLRQELKVIKQAPKNLVKAFTENEIDLDQVKDLKKMTEKQQEEAIDSIAKTKLHLKNIPKLVKNNYKPKTEKEKRMQTAQDFVDRLNDEVSASGTKLKLIEAVLEQIADEKIAELWPDSVKEGIVEGLEELSDDMKDIKKVIDKTIKDWGKDGKKNKN